MFGDSIYGTDTSLIAQLRIHYTDGITSRSSPPTTRWRTTNGPTTPPTCSTARRTTRAAQPNSAAWSEPGLRRREWSAVVERPSATAEARTADRPPVRVTEELDAKALAEPGGRRARLRPRAEHGRPRPGHARRRGRARRCASASPRCSTPTARCTPRTCAARRRPTTTPSPPTAPETWEPKFTFHGFRYVEITGVDAAAAADAITGVVRRHRQHARPARFETSDGRCVNQLQSNIVWGQRGNFLVDPDRHARARRAPGLDGRHQRVRPNTATYNMDSQPFLTKWLQDLRDTQNAERRVPRRRAGHPRPIRRRIRTRRLGRRRRARARTRSGRPTATPRSSSDSYDSMKRYVDYLDGSANGHIRTTSAATTTG